MKIILLRAGAVDPNVYKIATSLSRKGFNLKLLVWDRQDTVPDDNISGYEICRFRMKAPYNKYRIVLYLPFWWIYETYFLLKEEVDIIHACDLDTLLPAIFAKIIKRSKLCYTIYDFYALNFSDGQPSLMKEYLMRIIGLIEKKGIGFADNLFLVDENRYEQVKGLKVNNLTYIYNTPYDHLNTIGKQEKKTTDELVIFYAGLLLKTRGIEGMLKCLDETNDVRLILAGNCPEEDLMEEIVSRSQNVEYIGTISYDEVIKKTFDSDVLFRFSDPKILETKHASPNKLFEAMMCAKPIIVSDNSSMADVVRKEECGIIIQYGDVEAIRAAVLRLKNDPDYRRRLGANGRNAYEKRYSWDIMETRLIKAYNVLKDPKLIDGDLVNASD